MADITYIPTAEGWLYLAVVLDLFSRKIVGWATGDSLAAELRCRALRMALRQRRPRRAVAASQRSRRAVRLRRVPQLLERARRPGRSMSRRGNCYDNAVVESFFAT